MRQRNDGGEAILEAFRNLDIDYIISSPGSEWAPVWEALARQQINETPGPRYINCWHETLAVDMAIGYTRATGRMQAVLLHAGVGLLQGSMGIHSASLGEVPMLVCSGEAISYGEDPELDPQGQWYRNLSVVGRPEPVRGRLRQVERAGDEPAYALRAGSEGGGDSAAGPQGTGVYRHSH